MNINQMGDSKYLKRSDCGEDGIVLTMESVEQVDLAKPGENPEFKWILHFEENVKPMVLNKINCERIAKATGQDDTDNWQGKQIVCYDDPMVEFGGKLVGGIRVKAVRKAAPPAPPKAVAKAAKPVPVTPDGDEDDGDEVPF